MTPAEITAELRACRPAAPETLRAHVRALGTSVPAPNRLARLRLPRLRVAIPALAATAVAAAALVAVLRPAPGTHEEAAPSTRSAALATTAGSGASAGVGTTNGQVHGTPAPATTAADAQAKTPAASAPVAPGGGRAVDYQAQIGLEVKDGDALASATARAQTIVRDLGGYVVSATYATGDTGSSDLVLRVPSAKVQDALEQLTALGRITSQHVQVQDLQEQLDALANRIAVLRGRIAHVTALLADTGITAERRAQLEGERGRLQTSLRGLRQQESGVAQQAAFATVRLSLATDAAAAVPPPPSRARRTLDRAGEILAWEGVAALYALVVLAPLALLGGVAWFAARTRRRNVENRLLAR